ncbi:MAG: sigma-70 family RNA polymerase sigma factor [Acidobacteria bacterium]|nr:sigma-70 family RNA polymerase sigma factor [Acidobacteriota bacterium]
MVEPQGEVTQLLNQWQQGNQAAFDKVSSLIYGELHRIADTYLRQAPNGTMQPTALIHEAYLKLVQREEGLDSRKHFYALAAQAMRHILVDRARARNAAKRGAGAKPVSLEDWQARQEVRIEELLILDEALSSLAAEHPRLAQIIELHYFGGLTGVEISEFLGISQSTVSREQRLAEAWLKQALSRG